MVRLSAVIITLNEERNIERALESVKWADEIVVLDSGSVDDTAKIAKEFGARVEVGEWRGYVAAKNAAAEMAKGDWLLSIDADEEVTPELQAEIEKIIETPESSDGYRIPRKNHYLGKWIRHCGWYPDHQLRLWRKEKGCWQGGRVHESVRVEGTVGVTKAAINHYTYNTLAEHLERMSKYAGLHARDKFEAGKRTSTAALFVAAPWAFFRMYFLRLGILDGIYGLLVSAMGAFYALLKKSRLWELQRRTRPER